MKLAKRPYKPYTEDEISIRKDEIFRIVFGSNERYKYLKDFLEGILHKTITNIIVRNDVALDKIHADNKLMRLDILAEIEGNEIINIEMQNKNEYNVEERSEVYASGIVYIRVSLYPIAKVFGTGWRNKTKEEQWLAYLTCSLNNEELEELFAMNRSIEEINRIVDIVMTDDDVMDALNARILAKNLEQLKQAQAFKDGEESGKEIGEKENKIQIAKKMLDKGMPKEEIIELTGITAEELAELWI